MGRGHSDVGCRRRHMALYWMCGYKIYDASNDDGLIPACKLSISLPSSKL